MFLTGQEDIEEAIKYFEAGLEVNVHVCHPILVRVLRFPRLVPVKMLQSVCLGSCKSLKTPFLCDVGVAPMLFERKYSIIHTFIHDMYIFMCWCVYRYTDAQKDHSNARVCA